MCSSHHGVVPEKEQTAEIDRYRRRNHHKQHDRHRPWQTFQQKHHSRHRCQRRAQTDDIVPADRKVKVKMAPGGGWAAKIYK